MVTIDEVEYSFDCENCAFHKFMELYGYDANIETCWIDCTKAIQENVNDTFEMILQRTAIAENGALLYTGNIPTSELGGPPSS